MSSGTKGVWLEDLTSAEARGRFDRGDALVIPVASVGSHGAHLPLGTDGMIVRALGQRLIDRLPVVVAPVVNFDAQHMQAETFRQMLHEIVDAFRADGVTRIALLDSRLSAERPPRPRDVLVLNVGDGAATPTGSIAGSIAGLIDRLGAGPTVEHETSMVLALAPRSVRPAASAGAGDPSHATAFKGERLLAAWADVLVIILTSEWPQLAA
jgi:creatinine amidohydrolase